MKRTIKLLNRSILTPLKKLASTIAGIFRNDNDDNQFNHPFIIY
jgi:hypothetical protein